MTRGPTTATTATSTRCCLKPTRTQLFMLERCEKGLLSVAVIYSIIYFSITSLRAAVCSLNIAQHSLTGSSGYSLICLAVLVIPAPLAAVGLGGSLLFFVGLWVALGLWKGGGIHRGRCTCAHNGLNLSSDPSGDAVFCEEADTLPPSIIFHL